MANDYNVTENCSTSSEGDINQNTSANEGIGVGQVEPTFPSVQTVSGDACFGLESNSDDENGGDKKRRKNFSPLGESVGTVGDVIFKTLVVGLRHNLSWESQVDILKAFSTSFKDSDIPTHKLTYFNNIDHKNELIDLITFQIFCPSCELYLGKKGASEQFKLCFQCNRHLATSDQSNFFVTISLEGQLKRLLSDANVSNMLLTYRFNRQKESIDAIEDIYDGLEYKKHSDNEGILSSPCNFSWSFFVDGVSTGKTTGKTLWPIYLTLNELPYKERNKYIILGGLYIGPKDPNQIVFLQPFVEECNKLSSEGFTWINNSQSATSKVIPLCAVTDSVARWQVLNMQSFHAYFGCTFCYQEQERSAPSKRRFNIFSESVDRTPESTYDDAIKAFQKKDEHRLTDRHHRGVKGPSALIILKYFNLIWGFTVDYLHAILLGVVKTHMELLFDSTRKKFWIGLNDGVGLDHIPKTIDGRLLCITPPTGITRVPRTMSTYRTYKASEWRSWLIFYCIPCLKGLLKDKHLNHLAMLSKATCMLLQKSITVSDVEEAHHLLLGYCLYFQEYFDVKHTIYNIHLLTHIGKIVLNWGPLWALNSFCYEGQNMHLMQLYHSPNNVLFQIARKFLIYLSLPFLSNELVSSESSLTFAENVLDKKLKRFVRSENGVLSGKILRKNVKLTQNEEKCLLRNDIMTGSDECSFYQKLLIHRMRITSADYSSDKQNDDSYLMCNNGVVLRVRYIILKSTSVILLGQKVKISQSYVINDENVTVTHVRQVRRLGKLICVEASEIKCQCIAMNTPTSTLICSLPFGCYGD